MNELSTVRRGIGFGPLSTISRGILLSTLPPLRIICPPELTIRSLNPALSLCSEGLLLEATSLEMNLPALSDLATDVEAADVSPTLLATGEHPVVTASLASPVISVLSTFATIQTDSNQILLSVIVRQPNLSLPDLMIDMAVLGIDPMLALVQRDASIRGEELAPKINVEDC